MILVCGSRDFDDYEQMERVLANYPPSTQVVHGGARGADTMAGELAHAMDMHVATVHADWEKFGKGAGFRRNIEMLDMKPTIVLAFFSGERTNGTMHTVREAKKRGITVEVYGLDYEV